MKSLRDTSVVDGAQGLAEQLHVDLHERVHNYSHTLHTTHSTSSAVRTANTSACKFSKPSLPPQNNTHLARVRGSEKSTPSIRASISTRTCECVCSYTFVHSVCVQLCVHGAVIQGLTPHGRVLGRHVWAWPHAFLIRCTYPTPPRTMVVHTACVCVLREWGGSTQRHGVFMSS